ncbi:AraC family transcriptional regulator [Methylopila sp. 73B]|uniref:AraC family transcriptional regulator n=1 Tax=Methylopila sp. 73B TaxID=1120792 RepID=UPI0003792A5D|nr:AraC family transcriptional regulator [Methylopila sp. 73B]
MADTTELAALIARFATEDGVTTTAAPRLSLFRASRPTEPVHALYEPAFCIIAQGRKQVMLNGAIYGYDPAHYLVVSVDLPIVAQVTEASDDEPYLGLRLDLDPAALSAMMIEHGLDRREIPAGPGLGLAQMTPDLIDAVMRLTRLLDQPEDIGALAPLVEKEILYRLMTGDQASRLRQIALADSKLSQVNRAIDWIRRNFREPFRIDSVCDAAGMSPSALHAHFKTVTAMSPLQYQKQLRLQEARRLILSQARDAASAGHAVGYDSPSQFSREYSRLFGAPPLRDAAKLREAPELSIG